MRARRTDSVQPECIRAIKLLGLRLKELSRAGDGIEDLLVLLPSRQQRLVIPVDALIGMGLKLKPWPMVTAPPAWIFVECKTIERESTGYVRYTPAQKQWRAKTPDGPRITVTGFKDCFRQLRALMGTSHSTRKTTASPLGSG